MVLLRWLLLIKLLATRFLVLYTRADMLWIIVLTPNTLLLRWLLLLKLLATRYTYTH